MSVRDGLALCALMLAAACVDASPAAPDPAEPEARVTEIAFVGGVEQRLRARQRSPQPFRIVARDAAGEPVAGAEIEFELRGVEGVLSQPRALTDSAGFAETYLMETASGEAVLIARAGRGEASARLTVERMAATLLFEEATGAEGIPGLPHPDSLVRVRLLDTEGEPLAGSPVWFAGPPRLSSWIDTTDADGWASTVIRETSMTAGEEPIYAFVIGSGAFARTTRTTRAIARRVVLVSVDGLRADALDRYRPPTLLALAAEGASTVRARTVLPSLTTPAHLSLLSGVSPETHGIFGDEITFSPEMSQLQPLFRQAAGQGARAFMSSLGPLSGFREAFECKAAFGLQSLTLVDDEGAGVVSSAAVALRDHRVPMVFVHVPDPDIAGHRQGWTSEAYGRAVLAADSAVADVLAQVGSETLVVVTSDHGGGGGYGEHQHGSTAEEDVRIPLLLRGPAVIPGSDLGEVSILDVAPTALWAVGARIPPSYEGRALLEAFSERTSAARVP